MNPKATHEFSVDFGERMKWYLDSLEWEQEN